MRTTLATAALAVLPATTLAQFSIDWRSMDNAAGIATGTTIELGVTAGQPDASPNLAGGTLQLTAGFWAAIAPPPPTCPGDLDADNDTDVFDFNLFAPAFGTSLGEPGFLPAADLDDNNTIDVFDFNIFAPDFGCGT